MNFLIESTHRIYQKFKKGYGSIYQKRSSFVIDSIHANENILILGAREGFIKRIIDKTNNKLTYYLVDKFPSEIKGSKYSYEYADLNQKIPYPDNHFDCIVSDQLIEHLSQPDTFIREIKRVGKKDSTIIIGTENLAAWHNIFALILTFHPFSDHYSSEIRVGNPLSIHHRERIEDPFMRHLKMPTIRALKELLEYYDFKIIDIKGFGHLFPFGTYYDKYHSIQFVIVCKNTE
jgi:SAM-dependent methyltransferase